MAESNIMEIDMLPNIIYRVVDGEPYRLISITLEKEKIVVHYRDANLDFALRNFPERISKYNIEGMEPLSGRERAVWKRRNYPILYKRDREFYFTPHKVIPSLGLSNNDMEDIVNEARSE